ncbi:MAG: LysM peptidoglycan-binding domain-containing protein [Defluviitaleaceae bacterium]|nr:LysM peptidoglycan-binding domain-containing protein [Defluviitaleaceae bacterium]
MKKFFAFIPLLIILSGCAQAESVLDFVDGFIPHQAFAVYSDDEHFGYIWYDRGLTSYMVHDEVIHYLRRQLGGGWIIGDVRIDRNISVVPTQTQVRNTEERHAIISRIAREIIAQDAFEISAFLIYVNGEREARLPNRLELEHVERLLKDMWRSEHTRDAQIISDWDIRTEFVRPDETDFCTPESAFMRLDRAVMQQHEHIVMPGDSLATIAARFGTTVEQIISDNNISSPTTLFVGDVLMIHAYAPLVSVRTVDEIWTLHYPPYLEYTTERIVRINGIVQSREVFTLPTDFVGASTALYGREHLL